MHKENILKRLRTLRKPITVEKFIEICLYGEGGYYKDSNIIGSVGDFITAPEISQLFGEILGIYILNYWQNNINKKFNFVELGPGKGTLLLDIIKITKSFDAFNKAINIKLIEKNKKLIDVQKNNFSKFNININQISWLHDFKNFNKDPVIVIANEFLDCFPIRQFYKKNYMNYEKMVLYDTTNEKLKFVDKEIKNHNILKNIQPYKHLDVIEISKSRENYFSKVCKHILNVGGMMITIDYGYLEKPKKFTLQSVYNNKNSNVLDNIGNQDITSLVDFKSLISIAKSYNLKIDIFSNQRDFLIQNGVYERLKKILLNCKMNEGNIIKDSLNRIIDQNNMGSIFKVLVVSK